MSYLDPERAEQLLEVECHRRALALVRAVRHEDPERRARELMALTSDLLVPVAEDDRRRDEIREVGRRVTRTALQLAVLLDQMAQRALADDAAIEEWLSRGFDFALRQEREVS